MLRKLYKGVAPIINVGYMIWELYALLFLMSIASLVIGITTKRLIPRLLAVILFAVLMFQSNSLEYISGGTTIALGEQAVLSLLNWLLFFVAAAAMILGTIEYLKGGKEVEQGARVT